MSKPVHYLTSEGNIRGPVTDEEILNLRDSGVLSPRTRIKIAGSDGWTELADLLREEPSPSEKALKPIHRPPAADPAGEVSIPSLSRDRTRAAEPRSASLNLGFPLLAVLLLSFLYFAGMFNEPPPRVSCSWRIDPGIFNDDVVLTNTSRFALHDVSLKIRVVQDLRVWEPVLSASTIDANAEYRWSNVFSIPGNRITEPLAGELHCQENNSFRGADGYSQSLLDPLGFFDALHGLGLFAIPLLFVVGGFMISQLRILGADHVPAQTHFGWFVGLVFAGIIAVTVIQILSGCLFSLTAESFGLAADHPSIASKVVFFLAKAIASAKGKGTVIVFVLGLLLLLLGGGYALVGFRDAGLAIPAWAVWLGCTLGIALCEELVKTALGIMVFGALSTQGESRRETGTKLITCIALAHLAFGVGESFQYFGQYNAQGTGIGAFGLRIFWCVPLHASWGLITGAVANFLEQQNTSGTSQAQTDDSLAPAWGLLGLVLVCAPSILLHGLYDTFAFTDTPQLATWGVGAVSLTAAYLILKARAREVVPLQEHATA